MRRITATVLIAAVAVMALPVSAEDGDAVRVLSPDEMGITAYIPVIVGIVVMILLWRFLISQNLSNLQVAFEVGEDLFEVHRLTNDRREARQLMRQRSVEFGIYVYLFSMVGLLILIAELIFAPRTYAEPIVFLLLILVGLPIILSPWETLNAQLSRKTRADQKVSPVKLFFRRFSTMLILGGTVLAILVVAAAQIDPRKRAEYLAYGLLIFMSPTILAYGRIMGASWNMLVVNKTRTLRGIPNPVDPDQASLMGRFTALIIMVFVFTMPLAAINGVLTVVYVEILNPADPNAAGMYDFGGVIGWKMYQFIESPWIQKLGGFGQALKQMSVILTVYLSFNVAIIGLAFIFEVTRVMFLGGQAFGGIGGLILATPREIRSEQKAQNKLLFFTFAGFSGYSVLLMLMTCYTEFTSFMPYAAEMRAAGFEENLVNRTVWFFISAGHSIFLLTWFFSLARLNGLRKMKFDLSPDARREGSVSTATSDALAKRVDDAALADDLNDLSRIQTDDFEEDEGVLRLQRTRAKMIEYAKRGLWNDVADHARNVLAQSGGEDDEARMLLCASHIACRRLDAARESLRGLEQEDDYDEPEMLGVLIEWLDPWRGTITEDDLFDYENNSIVDLLRDLNQRIESWNPELGELMMTHDDPIAFHANVSSVALLRMHRRHEDAMDLALQLVRQNPDSAKARIAVALCLLDQGEFFAAYDIHEELEKFRGGDTRVHALGGIIGHDVDGNQLENSLAVGDWKEQRRWIDMAPSNPMAALAVKSGRDEALSANIWVASADAIEHVISPTYRGSSLFLLSLMIVTVPTLFWISFGSLIQGGELLLERVIFSGILLATLIYILRTRSQQSKVVRHRDQGMMVSYDRYLRRNGVKLDKERIPVGTHLLLSGLLLTINGAVYDVGYPGWLTNRMVDQMKPSDYKRKMQSERVQYLSNKPARDRKLQKNWWVRQSRSGAEQTNVWENLLGADGLRIAGALGGRRAKGVGELPSEGRKMTREYMSGRSIVSGTVLSEQRKKAVRRKSSKK